MQQELETFSSQIRFAVDKYTNHRISKDSVHQIIIGGLGGSGIAGRMVKNYFNDKLDIPVEVVSDYILPRYAGQGTLVILSSYSGNTEETLNLYHIAKEKGCKILILTTGGELLKLAQNDGYAVYLAEPGYQPRMALGYSFTYLFMIFFELLGQYKNVDMLKIGEMMENVSDYKARSAEIAGLFSATLRNKFVIITDPYFEGIAVRFAQQVQENAKLEAFVAVVPEANHNVIESYYSNLPSNYIFLNSGSNQRTNLRFYFLKELLQKYNAVSADVLSKDISLASVYATIYLLDWVSLQLAEKSGADAANVPNIQELKKFLSKN